MKQFKILFYIILVGVFNYSLSVQAQEVRGADKSVELDKSLKPPKDEVISGVFKDVVVVQRKAKQKEGKFLFSTYTSFDFSDGPIAMYGLNTNFGYAISNFFEVYFNYTPSYLITERSIVKKIRDIGTATGSTLDIAYAKPKNQMGIDVLWLPAYGKDSWGPYWIVRSDTFFKLGVGQISYDSGDKGLKYNLMVGKTYFLSDLLNLRFSAGFSQTQTIVDSEKNFNLIAVLETGLVFYF